MDDLTTLSSHSIPSRDKRALRWLRGPLAFLGGFVRYSLYTTGYVVLALVTLGLIVMQPNVRPKVRDTVIHLAQRVISAATSTSQDYQMREALRQQLIDLRRTIDSGIQKSQRESTDSLVVMDAAMRSQPNATVTHPLDGAQVDVRPLPYPFHSYLSIASDPDSMTFRHFEQIHAAIHDQLQLNLSDQIFVCNSFTAKGESGLDLALNDKQPSPASLDRFYRLLQAYRHGQVEGIHGWHNRAFASNECEFRLDLVQKEGSKSVRFTGLKFYDALDQNYIVFEYRMPQAGSHVQVKMGDDYRPVKSLVDQEAGMSEAVAWTPMYVEVPHGLKDPEVHFMMTGQPSSFLEVRNLMVTNFSQARIAAETRFLNEHNLRFLFYSEHGRWRNELSTALRVDMENNSRPNVLIDNPQQAANFYMMPYLEQLGITYFNASHHTGQYSVLPIDTLCDPHRFNDGVVRYNFKRFFSSPKNTDGNFQNPTENTSWEPWMGFHIDRLLKGSTRLGDGGIVYTHWGCGNDTGVLSGASVHQLEQLRERYYNLSGQTPHWKRVWVAPVAEILLYSQAYENIRDYATYNERTNTVQIRSWYDHITRQMVPWPRTRAFGLANLTFYVADSSSANVTIDGRDYTCLKRNPPDHTGRESVTLVDDYTPTVLFDEVDPLQKFGDAESENAASYFRQLGGFRGSKCLEMQLEDTQGQTTWKLPAVTSSYTNMIRWAYRKSNPDMLVGLRIRFVDGAELELTEGTLSTTKQGWQIARRRDDAWHDVVVDLAELQASRPIKRVPRGEIESITLFAESGATGDSVFLDAVEFLRHPIHPPNPNRRVLIAGRVEPPTDGVKIMLEDGAKQHQTRTVQGYFFFPDAVVRDSVVKVFAETDNKLPHYPLSGRYLEVRQNEVDIVIPLADLRDRNASVGLKKSYKGVSELNAEVGRIYQPRSNYVHSGIGTPQEFENRLQINNVGFLDRDRRFDNPDRARRILFLGNCNLFGHSSPRAWHANVLLEDQLTRSTGYPTEIVTMADSAMSFGKHWSYYRSLGRKFKPDLVCIFVHSSGVEMLEAEPDLFARFYEYARDRFPGTLFRSQSDGSLTVIEPDPEYFQHIGKDPELAKERAEEKKKGGYYTAGIDWQSIYYRKDWESLPEPARRAWNHFARILKFYQQELSRDGTRLVLVMTPEVQRTYGGTMRDFVDIDGQECNTRLLDTRLGKLCRDLGVGFFNLTPFIEQNYPSPALYSWRHDSHVSPYGFQMMAAGVHDYLLGTNFGELLPGNDPYQSEALLAYFRGRDRR